MTKLVTLYSSLIPVDCYILKGRLESDGIPCFIHDEQLIWVHPFKAVAIGGVKLKVPVNESLRAKEIIKLVPQGKSIDDSGEYLLSDFFDYEIRKQNETLSIKNKIRNDYSLVNNPLAITSSLISEEEIKGIIEEEVKFHTYSNKKFQFSMKQFLYELFDFNRSIFKYFRTKPVDYYLEKELVDNYVKYSIPDNVTYCPRCNSDNTSFGYAIDFKWDVIYFTLSILFMTPFFPIRKKYHCFNCGYDFKKQEIHK